MQLASYLNLSKKNHVTLVQPSTNNTNRRTLGILVIKENKIILLLLVIENCTCLCLTNSHTS